MRKIKIASMIIAILWLILIVWNLIDQIYFLHTSNSDYMLEFKYIFISVSFYAGSIFFAIAIILSLYKLIINKTIKIEKITYIIAGVFIFVNIVNDVFNNIDYFKYISQISKDEELNFDFLDWFWVVNQIVYIIYLVATLVFIINFLFKLKMQKRIILGIFIIFKIYFSIYYLINWSNIYLHNNRLNDYRYIVGELIWILPIIGLIICDKENYRIKNAKQITT